MENEIVTLEQNQRVGANGFDRKFGGTEFGERDWRSQQPGGDIFGKGFGDEFANVVIHKKNHLC
jgi:hypothetical protein